MDVGVDVGGTFTDFVGFRGSEVVSTKLLSTTNPATAVLEGFRRLGAQGMIHGTTVATNAILERKGARTAFLTTDGFEDLLTIGRQNRPRLYDLRATRPPPPVARGLCIGVRERVDAHGRVLLDLTDAEVRRIVRRVQASGAESVAISFLFSFLRPQHERKLAAALRDLAVSLSHEVLAEFREYERSSTTVLDAYVKPLVARYLRELRDAVGSDFLTMKSSGGTAQCGLVERRPIELVLSGPSGGLAAATALARRMRVRDLVTFDMGGTSADFSIVTDGQPRWTTEAVIDTFPIALPVVDIESVGAGGGSLAWVDTGGALRVGPTSAGASPGPMAYGRGGRQTTVTDADLVGGMLGSQLLGGRLPLRLDLAEKGIATLSKRLGFSVAETVLGIQRVVEANMAKGMRLMISKRGLDPADFRLLAFGGAGGMHGCALAKEIGLRRVVVPFLPGVFSAYGLLVADVRAEYSRSAVRPLGRSQRYIEEVAAEFLDRAKTDLASQGFDPARAILEPSLDLRYKGQSYEINVPLRGDVARGFHALHRARYGYATRSAPIELVTVRLVGRVPRTPRFPARSEPVKERRTTRRVLFDDGWHRTPVVRRRDLAVGGVREGPLVVEEDFATLVVPPDSSVMIDALGLLQIRVGT